MRPKDVDKQEQPRAQSERYGFIGFIKNSNGFDTSTLQPEVKEKGKIYGK